MLERTIEDEMESGDEEKMEISDEENDFPLCLRRDVMGVAQFLVQPLPLYLPTQQIWGW